MQQAFSLPWFVHVFPGRCPGLVCDEPFGLRILSQATKTRLG